MFVSTSDLLGLLVICVPILCLVVYSVLFSKRGKGEGRGGAKGGSE